MTSVVCRVLSEQNKQHLLNHNGHILLYFRSQLKSSYVLTRLVITNTISHNCVSDDTV